MVRGLARWVRSAAISASRPSRLGRRSASTPERVDEFAERLLVHVGNSDIGEVRVGPAGDVVAVDRFDSACPTGSLGVERQLGHRDNVLVVSVDERRRWDPINDRHASTHQREALRREIDDGSADGCAVGKPRLACSSMSETAT